jgi:protein-tyrosine phosphatase
MDEYNLSLLKEMSPSDVHYKLRLFLSFAPQLTKTEVPDPYYGGASGFEHVFDLVQIASEGLLSHLLNEK